MIEIFRLASFQIQMCPPVRLFLVQHLILVVASSCSNHEAIFCQRNCSLSNLPTIRFANMVLRDGQGRILNFEFCALIQEHTLLLSLIEVTVSHTVYSRIHDRLISVKYRYIYINWSIHWLQTLKSVCVRYKFSAVPFEGKAKEDNHR